MADDGSCEGVRPTGAFSGDGEFGAGFSEAVHGEFAQGCEVFRAVILAVSGAVFVEGHVEDPVQGVFDGPMGTDGCGKAFGRQAGGGEAIAGGGGGFAVHLAGCGDTGEGAKARPCGFASMPTVRENQVDIMG